MRAALTSLLLVAVASAANAQFSITPKLGLEPSNTVINYNDLRCLSPLGTYISPQVALRLDYKFKKTHGPYIGLSTSRSLVSLRFDDPETGVTNFTATAGHRQIRIEGGYQFSTKPISLGRSASRKSPNQAVKQSSPQKSGCGNYASRSSCGSKSKNKQPLMAKNKGWNMRIQPSAGLAYIPGVKSDIETGVNGANYQYNAGNWKTAFVAATDIEFGKGRDRVFVLGFQYLKGIGNLNTQTITTQAGSKATTTYLSSKTSSWNISLGVPFTLSKSKSKASKHKEVYKFREVKKQCIYKSPCRKF
jgi:hypothetical protein